MIIYVKDLLRYMDIHKGHTNKWYMVKVSNYVYRKHYGENKCQ